VRVDALRKACADIAHELNLPPSVVAPRAALEAIARTDARTAEAISSQSTLMSWQVSLIQSAVADVLGRFD
jgi:ribonuclease D